MTDTGYPTALQPNSDASGYNELAFVVNQIVGRIATSTLVRVMSVTPGPSLEIGTVSVMPCVHQVDGAMNATPHGTVYNLPYARVQGGVNAVICDPAVGDIGWAGFCSTDISVVKASRAPGVPGSRRRFDWSDGVYLFTVIGLTPPTRYIQFTASGIAITGASGDTITVHADTVNVTAGAVNLGGTGGAKVARVGDSVVGGVITTGSSVVKAT